MVSYCSLLGHAVASGDAAPARLARQQLRRAAQVRGSRWVGAPEDVAVEKARSDRYVSRMEPSRGPERPTGSSSREQAPEGAGGSGDTSGQNCEP